MSEPVSQLPSPSAPNAPPIEHRAAPRYAYQYDSLIHFEDSLSSQAGLAILRDISCLGVGLLTQAPLAVGTRLQIDLPCVGGGKRCRSATVVHVTEHSTGGWLIGCRFTPPLSNHNLVRILQYSPEDECSG